MRAFWSPQRLIFSKELQQGFITKSPKLKKNRSHAWKKSTENSQEFDFLVLAVKDVKTVNLLKDIKTIGAYSFENCLQLQKIEVSCDSKLATKCLFY